MSSVIQSSVLIGHIFLMRDLYSLDVDHNELKELLSDLNNIIIDSGIAEVDDARERLAGLKDD